MANLRVDQVKRAVLILIALAVIMFVGVLERESALVQDAMLKDPKVLHMPLQCDMTISQRSAGEPWQTRCYFFKQGE